MNCAICRTGRPQPGTTTVTLQRGQTLVVIQQVPAMVCDNCGEYYLDDEVAKSVYSQAEDAVRRRAVIEILDYAA